MFSPNSKIAEVRIAPQPNFYVLTIILSPCNILVEIEGLIVIGQF